MIPDKEKPIKKKELTDEEKKLEKEESKNEEKPHFVLEVQDSSMGSSNKFTKE